MASRSRRRGPGVQWLPVRGTSIEGNESSFKSFGIDIEPTGVHVIVPQPLTFDYPFDPGSASPTTTSLADFVGSAYILQRIVGKVTVGWQPFGTPTVSTERVMVGAGFFVAKADDTNPDIPAMSAGQCDPLAMETMMEPWIWRRTWLLGNPETTYGISWPSGNQQFGSVMDGPHIDSKIKRRIQDDDRLWFVLAGCSLFSTTDPEFSAVRVHCTLDYRLLGTLRKNRNQSAF